MEARLTDCKVISKLPGARTSRNRAAAVARYIPWAESAVPGFRRE
jgi:hypothetical protein